MQSLLTSIISRTNFVLLINIEWALFDSYRLYAELTNHENLLVISSTILQSINIDKLVCEHCPCGIRKPIIHIKWNDLDLIAMDWYLAKCGTYFDKYFSRLFSESLV